MLVSQTLLLLILADAGTASADPFTGLYQNWPWMIIVVALGRWLGIMLERVGKRHIAFIDALDRRDQESLVHQATTSIALGAISDKLAESRSKLSAVQSAVGQGQCRYQSVSTQPHGA